MSKIREQAARFISEAARLKKPIRPEEIQCVSGYWRRQDCFRFEIIRGDFVGGCWLPLGDFVKECRANGGAKVVFDGLTFDIYPKNVEHHFGEGDGEFSACDLCGEDGGTTCGAPGCGY